MRGRRVIGPVRLARFTHALTAAHAVGISARGDNHLDCGGLGSGGDRLTRRGLTAAFERRCALEHKGASRLPVAPINHARIGQPSDSRMASSTA
jgi:hypothetical protein